MDLFFLGLELEYNIGQVCVSMSALIHFPTQALPTLISKPELAEDTLMTLQSTTPQQVIYSAKFMRTAPEVMPKSSEHILMIQAAPSVMFQSMTTLLIARLDGLNTTNEGLNKCESDYSSIFTDGGDHPNCDDGVYIERLVAIGTDSFKVGDFSISDGVCGLPSAPNTNYEAPSAILEYNTTIPEL